MARHKSVGTLPRRTRGSNDAIKPVNKTPCVCCRLKKAGCDKSFKDVPCSRCKRTGVLCIFAPRIEKDLFRPYKPPKATDKGQHDSPTTTYTPHSPLPSSPKGPDNHSYTSDSPTLTPIDPGSTLHQATPNFADPDQSFSPAEDQSFEIVVNWSNTSIWRLTIRHVNGELMIADELIPNLPGTNLKYWLENHAAEYGIYYWLEVDSIWEERLRAYLGGLTMVLPMDPTRPTGLNTSVM